MTHIKTIIYEPQWLERYYIDYFSLHDNVFTTASCFRKDRKSKAIGFAVLTTFGGLSSVQLIDRYPQYAYSTMWKMVKRGMTEKEFALISEDLRTLPTEVKYGSPLKRLTLQG